MIRWHFLACFVFIGGTCLRFHALDRQSLWDDEMSTIRTISTPRPQIIQRFKTYETHPPLYFLQVRAWRVVAGKSLVRLRANSAFWGTASLAVIFGLGSFYFGSAGGLLAMAFLAVSPIHLAYSQEARPYALGIFLGIAGLWVVEKLLGGPSPYPLPEGEGLRLRGEDIGLLPMGEGARRADEGTPLWILLGLIWTALLYTHYWGAFVVAAQAIYGAWKARHPSEKRRIIVVAAICGLAFVLWLPVLYAQLGIANELAFWAPYFSFANLAKSFAAFSGLYFNMASYVFYLPTTVGIIAIFGIAFATALVLGFKNGPVSAKFWLTVGLMIPWLLSLWKPPIYVWYRYPVLMLPAFILLIVGGIVSLENVWPRLALGAICLTSQLWACQVYFTSWNKANPKAVVQYVHWLRSKDTIVIRPAYFGDLFAFYDQGTLPSIDQNLLDSREKRDKLRGKDIILLAFDVPSDPVTEAILTEFHPLSGRNFPGLAHLGITVYHLK